ncbi:MAG: homoserine dehydrogenase, partial [Actinomycetes bacterium]
MKRTVNVGLLGCGNVGAALVQLVDQRGEQIRERTGIDLRIARVAVRSTSKAREVAVDPAVLTTDARSVVDDPSIDLVVEVIGG